MAEDNATINLSAQPGEAISGLQQLNVALEPLKMLGKGLKEPLEIIGRFGGIFSIVAGAASVLATGVAAVASEINRASREAELAEERFKALASVVDSVGRADPLAGASAELRSIIDQANKAREAINQRERTGDVTSGDGDFLRAKLDKETQDSLDALSKRQTKERDAKRNAAEADRVDARHDAERRFKEETDAMEESLLPANERIRAKMERDIETARTNIAKESPDFDQNEFDRRVAVIRRAADAEIAENDRVAKEKTDRELEAAQQVARAAAEEMSRAFREVVTQLNGELSQAINQNNSRLTATVDNIGRLVQMIYGNLPSGGGR